MIEIQLTLEALGVFNLPKCQKAAQAGESSKCLPAVQGRCEQLSEALPLPLLLQIGPYTQTITSHLPFGQR